MRILFVIPPDRLRIESSVSEKLDRGREVRAPLGLLYVAAAVAGEGAFQCMDEENVSLFL